LRVAQRDVPASDPERLLVAAIVPPLLTRHGQLHVLKEPKGARPFDQLRAAALAVEIDGLEVAIASLDDLIRMKRASAPPPTSPTSPPSQTWRTRMGEDEGRAQSFSRSRWVSQ
jgi:hypothetical protein